MVVNSGTTDTWIRAARGFVAFVAASSVLAEMGLVLSVTVLGPNDGTVVLALFMPVVTAFTAYWTGQFGGMLDA